jgi:hypothetical protein
MSASAAMNKNAVLLNQSKHLFLHCHASALMNYLSVQLRLLSLFSRQKKKHCHLNKEESTEEETCACHCWSSTEQICQDSGARSTDLQKGATLQIISVSARVKKFVSLIMVFFFSRHSAHHMNGVLPN